MQKEAEKALDCAFEAVQAQTSDAPNLAKVAASAVDAWESVKPKDWNVSIMKERLLKVYLGLNDLEAAEQLVASGQVLVTTEMAEAQWRAGRRDAYRDTVQKRLEHFASCPAQMINAHHTMSAFEDVARMQTKIADADGLAHTIAWMDEYISRVDEATATAPWTKTAAYCSFFSAVRASGDHEKAQKLLHRAEQWAEAQTKSKSAADSSTTAWLSMTDAWAGAGDLTAAMRCAKRIPNCSTRREKLAALLAQAGRDDEVEKLIGKCRSVTAKMDLALWVAGHLLGLREGHE